MRNQLVSQEELTLEIGVQVPEQKRCLEEHQTGIPHCGRSAQEGQDHFPDQRLNQQDQGGAHE